ncbi:hypothetical protein SAMN05421848_2100 [Kushneria avicenniae]|uniref:Nudix-type nucleoside diphosphatase, YffH/AdpP family n=1 Tax=Kushneria avicenniae TaxID=402385 RepID=A0A1I1KP53_9GAMM|nr:hypothetical protein [Kushneria avicenniae]SFC62559.1 hypothetical protein SAMN05421848_2100 [Kushneria avicenniae]
MTRQAIRRQILMAYFARREGHRFHGRLPHHRPATTGYCPRGATTHRRSVTERPYFVIADDRLNTGKSGGFENEGEDIEVLELPLSEALEMIRTGEIVDGKTIMLLQHAALLVATVSEA